MLNKGMHKPSPLFCMDIVVQFIFLFFFISRLTIQTFFGWVDFFSISLFTALSFMFSYVFLEIQTCIVKRRSSQTTENDSKYRKHMTLKCDIFFHFLLLSITFYFMPERRKYDATNNEKLHSLLLWIKKGERQNQI